MEYVRFEYGIYPVQKIKDGGLFLINGKWYHHKGTYRWAKTLIELCDSALCYSGWFCPEIPYVFNFYGYEDKLNKILEVNKNNKVEIGIWTEKGLSKVGYIHDGKIILTSKLKIKKEKI